MPLSGPEWVNQFPSSASTTDLAQPFRGNVERFVAALRQAGAAVSISATLRPAQRAYLMHYAWMMAREGLDPGAVPAMAGVDIQWAHTQQDGKPDPAASKAAAEQMVQKYHIVYQPALNTNHADGNAIDMTIAWEGDLTITDGAGAQVVITSQPRNGAGNIDLRPVGASYGAIKLPSDPPHWSKTGH